MSILFSIRWNLEIFLRQAEQKGWIKKAKSWAELKICPLEQAVEKIRLELIIIEKLTDRNVVHVFKDGTKILLLPEI